MTTQAVSFHSFRERSPGPRWRALFDATWPAYRSWYLREGADRRPDAGEAASALARYMPELVPTWRRLTTLTGGDETAAGMLTHWNLPAFAPGCSQAVVDNGERALVRNYDYHPDLFEQVIMSTRLTGVDVIGTSDCLWGLLDGMNAAGLAVSLSFGGARGSGPGFGIPLVLRYLLEVCSTVDQGARVLERVPVSMSYNITMTDRTGAARTTYVAPGRAPETRECAVATNHFFDTPEDAEHAARYRSVERRHRLDQLLAARPHPDLLAAAFQRAPLRSTDFAGGFGTLYTADYRPDTALVHYRWPGTSWTRTFDSPDAELTVHLPVR